MTTKTRKIKGYEEGFDYGTSCGRRMSAERRAENARHVESTVYFALDSPTRDYWRGFVNALRSDLY